MARVQFPVTENFCFEILWKRYWDEELHSLLAYEPEKKGKNIASAGNRTRINCLEGSYADHYTTDAILIPVLPKGAAKMKWCVSLTASCVTSRALLDGQDKRPQPNLWSTFTFLSANIIFCTDWESHSARASIAQWQSVGLVNQRSWVQSSLEACFLNKSVTVGLWEKDFDPDVIRTRSLLIWSQTRYRCATESSCVRSYRDLNSDRWIQSPEC